MGLKYGVSANWPLLGSLGSHSKKKEWAVAGSLWQSGLRSPTLVRKCKAQWRIFPHSLVDHAFLASRKKKKKEEKNAKGFATLFIMSDNAPFLLSASQSYKIIKSKVGQCNTVHMELSLVVHWPKSFSSASYTSLYASLLHINCISAVHAHPCSFELLISMVVQPPPPFDLYFYLPLQQELPNIVFPTFSSWKFVKETFFHPSFSPRVFISLQSTCVFNPVVICPASFHKFISKQMVKTEGVAYL